MGKHRKKRAKGNQNGQPPGPGPQQGVRPAAPAPALPRPILPQGGVRAPAPGRPMRKHRKKRAKGNQNGKPPGPGPQCVVRPAAPAPAPPKVRWPRPHPPHGGVRALLPTPGRPMGLPGQRFPRPPHNFGPQPSRMMMMMDNMADDRRFMNVRPPLLDVDPRFKCGPRFRPPEFDDRPAFPMMNPGFAPMERFGPRDPHFMQPMDVHNVPLPGIACPPQSQKKKDQPALKDTKINSPKTMASKLSTFKNITANVPRGRSLGIISFIGNNCGFIEREDLKKFSFVFDAFFGIRSHLVPGVKVHFTAVKNLGKECAVDVKVAPRGTEDIDSTVYEGVVTTALPDGKVKEPNPGCIRTILSVDPVKLPFGKQDTNVTLLLYDRVEFQLLTDLITREQRATHIKPKTPETFQLTKEIREMGVIMNKTDGTLTIMTETYNNLTASAADSLSEDELDVMDEVELTVITVNDTKKAVRLKKLPEGSVTFNHQAKSNENISGVKDNTPGTDPVKDKLVTSETGSQESAVSYDVSSEKYEGTVVKIMPKNSQTQEMKKYKQEPSLGQLVSTVEGTEKRISFKSGDVIAKATMLVGDKVQFNISTNSVTKEECAVNVDILPDTFQADSEEQRKIGFVVKLDDNSGFIKTQQDPQLYFDMSEVMEETKLALFEKVAFTIVSNEAAGGGNQAVRIRRLKKNVFTSAPKLYAFGIKEKKKMAIKLLKDPKDYIKDEVKSGHKSSESMDVVKPNKGNDKASPSITHLKKGSEIKQEKTKPKGDQAWSRSREDSQHRYSRSRSRENGRRRCSRSRSRSRDRGSNYYRRCRSSSREKRDSRYRHSRSRSRDHSDRYRRSRSRSRDRSGRSARRRSRSPDHRDDRYKKQGSSKESGIKKRTESPKDNVGDELLRKRRELMELNELIARKKAIVAMEQNVKKIEPEVEIDNERGIKTFDYQHVHRDTMWMPDLKPVKSILKKQSELPDPQSQASTSKETAAFVKSESLDIQMGCLLSAFDLNVPVYSKFKSDSENSLTTKGSDKILLPQSEDPELVRKKKQLEELSESVARKRAIIAMEQKTKAIRDAPAMEKEYEFDSHSYDQFVMSKENLWSSDIKSEVQPKKSILKNRSEFLSSQSNTTSADEYGQPSQDDSAFTKPPSQSTAAALLDRSSNPQPVHSDTLGLFNRLLESSATLRVAEPSPFNKAVVPQSVTQASDLRSVHDSKPSRMSKRYKSQDDQHRASSHQTHDHSHSSNPSTSQAAPSEQKCNLTTQMERFLSALNKADSSIVSSLFQEARKDLALMGTQKAPQPHLDSNIPFMDELYDPFKENDDEDQPLFIGRGGSKHFVREQIKSPVKTETRFDDLRKDDLLPRERAVKDGSDTSWLFGMQYNVEPTAKAESKKPYGHQLVADNWNMHEEDPNRFKRRNHYEGDTDLYVTESKRYADDDNNLYKEHSQSVEYQNVHPNVQHSYVQDSEMPDSKFNKSIAFQQTEESNEDKDKKAEHFEKIQSLLQTVGLHLDTAEVSKLADRTKERLYGKTIKPHSASFDQKREQSMSGSERRGRSRAGSSDSDGFRSVSPAQSSNRKVYMSYKDSVKYRDEHKVEDVDLTGLKRTVMNLKSTKGTQEPSKPSSESTTVSEVSYQPASTYGISTAQPGSSQYAQNSTIPTLTSQYSYHSNEQNLWGSASALDSSQNTNLQYLAYPYGFVPPPPNLCYASGLQAVAQHMMSAYSSYPTQMGNPYSVPHPLTMPIPYGPPPVSNPLLLSSTNLSYPTLRAGHNLIDIKTQPVRCLKTIEMTKTVKMEEVIVSVNSKAKPKRKARKKKKAMNTQANNSPAKSLQEAAGIKLVSTITEDDIKAKQKKRLEQFNQRMKLKKEQQMEAQRSRGQNRNSAPGTSTPSEKKNVWICGHSLVFWAEKRATSPEFGMQLGMHPDSVRIWWKGVQGMKWEQLLPLLLQLKDNWPKPDVLIIHLGGNDISTTAPEAFIETVKKDLTSMKSIFPECLLVWSNTLPRQTWRGSEDGKEMDIIRSAINDSIHQIMTERGGSALSHNNIKPDLGLYRPDGVHLSGKGIDTFNLNLQDFLEKWESETETKMETSDPSV